MVRRTALCSTLGSTCSAPSGYVDDLTDCDDTNSSVYPDAIETCNEVDDDCDGDTDEEVEETFYADDDEDGYGDSEASESACDQPSGYVTDDTDCDDTDSTSYPDAPESCDDLDNDCDDSIDENISSKWYVDADGDLYGAGEAVDVICGGNSAELVDNDEDCDDDESTAFPGGTEVCDDDIDQDCDGSDEECPTEDTASTDTGA